MPRLFTICSIAVHTIVVGSVMVSQLLAVGSLPTPRVPLTFEGATPIRIVDMRPPSAPRRSSRSGAAIIAPSSSAAPIEAPATIRPEPDGEPAGFAAADGMAIEGGAGTFIGVGAIDRVPPPAAPAAQAPIRLHAGMQPPRKLVHVDPVYPRMAQAVRIEGVVILEATIDAEGRVQAVRVLRSIPLLDQAAVDAVKQWTFTPILLNGAPVPFLMTVTVNFTLKDR
jgi:protein TonB